MSQALVGLRFAANASAWVGREIEVSRHVAQIRSIADVVIGCYGCQRRHSLSLETSGSESSSEDSSSCG